MYNWEFVKRLFYLREKDAYVRIGFILLSLLLIFDPAFAQQTDASKLPYITVERPKIKPLTELHQRLIIRSAIAITMKSQKYQFIFSSPKSFEEAKFAFYKLELKGKMKKFGKNKVGYDLVYQIIDAKTNNVIKEVKKKLIEKRHLVYKSKVLLYELFFGKEKAEELEEKLRLETEREIKRASLGRSNSNRSAQAQKVDKILDKLIKASDDPDDTSEEIIAASKKKVKKKVKNKRPLRLAKFESPDLDLRKEEIDVKVKPPSQFKVYSEYSYGFGYSTLKVSSISLIEVENDLRMVGFNVNAAVQLEENSFNRIHLGLGLNKITSENIFSVSAPRVFHILYDFGSMDSFVHFQGGLEFETQSFANLGAKGEGIKAWDGTFLWIKAGIIFDFSIKNRKYGLGGFFYSPFVGSSNFNALDSGITLTGSKIEAYGIAQVYKKWHVKISVNQANITSQGLSSLENKHSIVTLGAIYQ